MPLAILDPGSAAAHLTEALGADWETDEGLCAMLRAEVHARGNVQRAVALDRVRRLIEPMANLDAERLASMCDALVREGDLVLAPGGVLWATPLRVVPVGSGGARLFGSVPNGPLARTLDTSITLRRASRSVRWSESMGTRIGAVGGRVVTSETWAGLEHAPVANDAFLERLDERLAWESAAGWSLERDGPLEWRGWVASGERPGWRRDATAASLWWARTAFRGHVRAWTAGDGSPSMARFIELGVDDADRARFALSRRAGAGAPVTVARGGGHAVLEVPTWLPRPEYRWLSLQAEPAGDEVQTTRWRVPTEAVNAVAATLADRLGLLVVNR